MDITIEMNEMLRNVHRQTLQVKEMYRDGY